MKLLWKTDIMHSPIFATAIHNGHYVDKEILKYMKISEDQRLREEDPFTENFLKYFNNKLIVYRSRFQVDLNRPFEKCVYLKPEDAWGLDIWEKMPPIELLEKSYNIHKMFYKNMDFIINYLLDRFKNIVVLDIHSYNYRRKSPFKEDPKEKNPDINLGTRTLKNRKKWENLIKAVKDELSRKKIDSMAIDVRENVKFGGGYFPYWLHNRFYPNICVLSIEFKKIFMDEWKGEPYFEKIEKIAEILKELKNPILDQLKRLERS